MYRHPDIPPGASPTRERDRMPYIQIDATTWIVMRNPHDYPVAVIELIAGVDGVSKYLLRRWNLNPANRPLIGLFDTLEAANFSVKWEQADTPEDAYWKEWPNDQAAPGQRSKLSPGSAPRRAG